MAGKNRRRRRKPKGLGVIWEIPDTLWERIGPILEEFWPTKVTGRRHAEWRQCLNAIIFRGLRQNLWVKTAENGEVFGGVRVGFSEGWQGK